MLLGFSNEEVSRPALLMLQAAAAEAIE